MHIKNAFLIISSFFILVLVFNFFISIINPSRLFVLSFIDNETCPFCYGKNLCEDIYDGNLSLRLNGVRDLIKLISTKNAYRGLYKNKLVYIKKLASTWELQKFDDVYKQQIKKQDLLVHLNSQKLLTNFKSCNANTSNIFLEDLISKWQIEEIWTMLHINVEPLLLHIFQKNSNWPVPKVFGYCGRIMVQEECGETLNNFENVHWLHRAYIALQLVRAAVDFTFKHSKYRIYLTDISPDNVVVQSETMKISFIDLENAVLNIKRTDRKLHCSDNVHEEYAFSQDDICNSHLSDHNIFSICKLVLARNAPWPMMKRGLLHNPPISIIVKYKILFKNIRYCVLSRRRRFNFSKQIINSLNDLLHINKYIL